MALYCGIDLHSNNHMVIIIDENDRRLVEKRLPNRLEATLELLAPHKESLVAVAVESTFNWYWLVDGLMAAGYPARLANPSAMQRYEGLKHTDDAHDAFWLAHLLRLGILPIGYIYPRETRAVRDLMRRRLQLVRMGASCLISIQSQIWRSSGLRVSANAIRAEDFVPPIEDATVRQSVMACLTVYRALKSQILAIEQSVLAACRLREEFEILRTMTGVGPILGLTIMLETGDIERFKSVGNYASYCRLVKSQRLSNGKRKGDGNRKCGNKYLSWAFSEAAHYCVRYDTAAKRFYERKRAKTNGIVAIRAIAHKLARAAYYMLREQTPFASERLFAH